MSDSEEWFRFLEENGFRKIDEETYFKIFSKKGGKILSYDASEVSTIITRLNKVLLNGREKTLSTFERIQRHGFIVGFLKKTCTKYIDPNIQFKIYPTRFKKVTFHILSFKLEGTIEVKLDNNSTEGKEGKAEVWRWENCPTDNSAYTWTVVKGSADIASSWSHDFFESESGAKIGSESSQTSKVVKGESVSVSASWSTTEPADVFNNLLSVFIGGVVKTSNGFDVTISYEWKGATQTKVYHVNTVVLLPVDALEVKF